MISRFARERQGSVATTAAIALVPMMIVVGVAVDYSNHLRLRGAAEGALDAAINASIRAKKLRASERGERVANLFSANFPQKRTLNRLVLDLVHLDDRKGERVHLRVRGVVDTLLMGSFGTPTMDFTFVRALQLGRVTRRAKRTTQTLLDWDHRLGERSRYAPENTIELAAEGMKARHLSR